MRTRLRTTGSVILALGLLAGAAAGCSSSREPESNLDAAISLPVDPPRVSLKSAGQAPHSVLAFADDGARQNLTLTLADAFAQGTGDKATIADPALEDAVLTTLEVVGDASVGAQSASSASAAPGGSTSGTSAAGRRVTLTLHNPQISDQAKSSDAAGIDGFELGWLAQPNGRAESVTLAAPKGASDKSRALAEKYLKKLVAQPVIFPSEPIGAGASWSIDTRVAGDSTMLRTTTYTLLRLEGTRAELSAEVTERPAVTALPMDSGGELKVLSTRSVSRGTLSVDLSKPLPTKGDISLTTRVVYGKEDSAHAVYQDLSSAVKFAER